MHIHIGRTHIHIPRRRTYDKEFKESEVHRNTSKGHEGEFASTGSGSKTETKSGSEQKEFLPGQKPLTKAQAHLV